MNIIFEQLDNNNDRISFLKGNQPQQAPKPQPNTPYSNGQAQCVTTCKSDGSCKVFQVLISGNQLIYSGKLAGSCSSPLLGGSCSRIPDKCKRGSKISTQCGSPCKTSTRTITEWKNKKFLNHWITWQLSTKVLTQVNSSLGQIKITMYS